MANRNRPKTADTERAERIDVSRSWELEYWSNRLGVTPDRLIAAVNAVGNSVARVLEHLKKS